MIFVSRLNRLDIKIKRGREWLTCVSTIAARFRMIRTVAVECILLALRILVCAIIARKALSLNREWQERYFENVCGTANSNVRH